MWPGACSSSRGRLRPRRECPCGSPWSGPGDLPELVPLMRAYCDFYQVDPGDQALLELSQALLADPRREGLQLLTRDDSGGAVGFALPVGPG